MKITGDNGGDGAEIGVVFRDLFGGSFGAEAAWTGRTEKVFNCLEHPKDVFVCLLEMN